ncbi:MAG: DUF4136 domain-containing protein [Gammaproteobacteria bacterium]|nr:DUF4136 domain-containing protein [Gammaproteobacteria bacterium]
MRLFHLVMVGCCAALVAACSSGPTVEIHPVDTDVIGTFTTFEVVPDRSDVPLGPMRTRQSRAQIEAALGEEMRRLGYRQVESGGDIQLEYVTYVTEEYQEEHYERVTFAGAVIDRHLPEPRDVPLRVGTLHVHLLHDGKALYEGIASGLVEGPVTMERIRAAAKALLKQVPPGPLMEGPAREQRLQE